MVAHVEHLLPLRAQLALQPGRVATGEAAGPAFQGGGLLGLQEEDRLPAAHHHQVEVVRPPGPGLVLAVQQVAQHPVGEGPVAVGHQEQLLAVPLEAVQRQGQLGIPGDEEVPVRQDLGLHLAVAVGGVDGPADIVEELEVVLRLQVAVVEAIHQPGVEVALGDLEERVDAAEALGGRGEAAAAVGGLQFRPVHGPAPVAGAHHLPLPVQLQQVAPEAVQHQAAHGEVGIVGLLQQPGGVAVLAHQELDGLLEGQVVDLRRAVAGQRVVHVEADGPDLPQGEGAQGVELVLRRQAVLAVGDGRRGEVGGIPGVHGWSVPLSAIIGSGRPLLEIPCADRPSC